jgi:hypothetical protein
LTQVGAIHAIEGEHGLLRVFGTVCEFDSVVLGLGKTWMCKDTAIKVNKIFAFESHQLLSFISHTQPAD